MNSEKDLDISFPKITKKTKNEAEKALEGFGQKKENDEKEKGGLLYSLKYAMPVSDEEKMYFFQLLGVLLDAGVNILKAVRALAQRTQTAKFRDVLEEMANFIESGDTLYIAMRKFPAIFESSEISVIQAGEQSGKLEAVLIRLSEKLSKFLEIKTKIKNALIYPSVIILSLIASVSVIMIVVVPKLLNIFEGKDFKHGISTLVLFSITKFWMKYWALGIAIFLIIIFGFYFYIKSPKGSSKWEYLKIDFPVIGSLTQKIALSRFAHSFRLLASSGVPVLDALEISAESSGNMLYRDAIMAISKRVRNGEKISENLEKIPLFPKAFVEMFEIGEKSGSISKSLEKIAKQYDREVDMTLKKLTSLVEPMAIILVGLVVAFLAFAVMSPILRMSEVF